MRDEGTLVHCEHESVRSFEDVVRSFEAAVGHADPKKFFEAVAGASSTAEFETRMHAFEGSSGFILFFAADHGGWMSRIGLEAKSKMYVIGNPLIARTMIRHDPGVGLNVPVRVLIYEDAHGVCRLAYDLPSSLMARLKNTEVTAAAKELDRKLIALAEAAAGAPA